MMHVMSFLGSLPNRANPLEWVNHGIANFALCPNAWPKKVPLIGEKEILIEFVHSKGRGTRELLYDTR